jgi:DNA-binding transcriptional regulator YdaS (Cro superfamily)
VTVLAHDLRASFDGVLLVVVLVVGGVGYVIARRQSANPIGWLLLTAAALFALYAVGVLYAVVDYHRHGGRLPLGRVALTAEPSWSLGIVLLGLAVAVFPDGTIGSKSWRVIAIVYLAAGAWFTGLWSLSQATLRVGRGFDVDGVGNYLGTQTGFPNRIAELGWTATPLIVVLFAAFVVRQWAAWRHAAGERRQQLTWLMAGGAVSIASILVVANTNVSSHWRIVTDLAALGLTAIPLAIGVGILKYRLYDIDRLISRTISWAIVTGLWQCSSPASSCSQPTCCRSHRQ